MKKVILFVALLFCFYSFFSSETILTKANQLNISQYEIHLKLTPEQKELLNKKKTELKNKYLNDFRNKTIEEKKEAYKKYKEELSQFCEKELGIKYPYHKRMNPLLPFKNFPIE